MNAAEPRDFPGIKATFPPTDKVGPYHVFEIGGNKIRLVAVVHYRSRKLFIRHMDYATRDAGDWKER